MVQDVKRSCRPGRTTAHTGICVSGRCRCAGDGIELTTEAAYVFVLEPHTKLDSR